MHRLDGCGSGKGRLRFVVSAAMKLRVSENAGNFLIGLGPVSFSGMILFMNSVV
jgi:hypothetical protein